MLGLPQIIPAPYRIAGLLLGLALALGAAWAHGHHTAAVAADRERTAEHGSQAVAVAQAGEQQAKHVASVVLRQTKINQDSDNAFNLGRAALSDLYRVRDNATRRDHPAVPAGASPASEPDASAPDDRPGADAPAAVDQCAALSADAALTTLQLLHLQAWIREQGTVP